MEVLALDQRVLAHYDLDTRRRSPDAAVIAAAQPHALARRAAGDLGQTPQQLRLAGLPEGGAAGIEARLSGRRTGDVHCREYTGARLIGSGNDQAVGLHTRPPYG
ncbi:MAG: hypothetical protein E6J45_01660 [Chloroflexi bacterium]|nr:MAG: hypothetical protein E6J45_01660 [Chloroflexota bacterium]